MANTSETAATIAREQQPESYDSETAQENNLASTPEPSPLPGETEGNLAQAKPDVSRQDVSDLLPKLFNYFHSNREELARALGVHRSTVDRWMNGTSRPNNSTLLRMRRLAQERDIH